MRIAVTALSACALSFTSLFVGSAQAQSVNIGETAVLSTADSQNANVLSAQMIQLKATQTIQSLSFYVSAASGYLILAIYDATGPSGGPGALKDLTATFAPKTGWNTAKVLTPASLAAGNYWLAYLPSSNALSSVKTNASGNCAYYSVSFGSLPTKFSTSPASCTPTTWSFYATLTTSSTFPVNGACGSSNGATASAKPTANLCTAGTASTVSGSGPWAWSCAGSNGGSTASCSDKLASQASGSAPTLIQHVASSANPVGLGIPGNNYKIPLPNPVLAGDALVLAITYSHGNLVTISDTLRQIWPAASIVEDGGANNYTTAIYVRCGSAGGSETITVGLSSSVLPFEYTVSEFNNVATSTCIDGSVGAPISRRAARA